MAQPRIKNPFASSALGAWNKHYPLILLALFWFICFLVSFLSLHAREQSTFLENALLGPPRATPTALATNQQKRPFDWNDIPISQKVKGACGIHKCFWRSVSDPDNIGYLVASARKNYETLHKAYEFAVNVLDKTCHAKHLLLEPPAKVKVAPDFVKELNNLHRHRLFEYQGRKHKPVFEESDTHLIVQKVRVAPNPGLPFGYIEGKWDMLVEKDLPEFRKLLTERDVDMTVFGKKLEDERRKIECAMDHSLTYWFDLQGLIDVDGNYFHMDSDSQFWCRHYLGDIDEKKAYRKRHELIGKFNEMIQRIIHPPPEGVEELPAWDDDD